MMVRIFPSHPAGTGRPLGTYILAAKHEHEGEHLGAYVDDPAKDKVDWSRTVNTGVDNPLEAIGAIERLNAQNTNWHTKSRWMHMVVSFPEGENPTREQLNTIEDRLMAAIGMGDHWRLSGAHHDTKNRHFHIAWSRLDPVTMKAKHPLTHWKLQAEAARLEINLGLHPERKTMMRREQQEIAERVILSQRKFDQRALEEFLGKYVPDQATRLRYSARVLDLHKKALEEARWADHVPSGLRQLTVQDIARRLSPEYDKLMGKADELEKSLRKGGIRVNRLTGHSVNMEKTIANRGADIGLGEYRIAERAKEMSLVRRGAHFVGTKLDPHPYRKGGGAATHLGRILRDTETTKWENFKGQAEHTYYAYQAHLAAQKGEFDTAIRAAEAVLNADLRPGVKLHEAAERELARLHQAARSARDELKQMHQGIELQQEKLQPRARLKL